MKYAVGVSITMVRPDGEACRNEMVCWNAEEAVKLMRSTWGQFRAHPYDEAAAAAHMLVQATREEGMDDE